MPISRSLQNRLINAKDRWVQTKARALQRAMRRKISELLTEIAENLLEQAVPIFVAEDHDQKGPVKIEKGFQDELDKLENTRIASANLFDNGRWSAGFETTSADVIRSIYESNLIDVDSGLGIRINANDQRDLIANMIGKYRVTLANTSQTITAILQNEIEQAVRLNLSPGSIYRKVKAKGIEVGVGYLKTLSRDLVASAFSQSKNEFAEKAFKGIAKNHEWLASRGGKNDREHHNDIQDRGVIPFEEMFVINSPTQGVVHARYPNDPRLHVSERRWCKCVERTIFRSIGVLEPEEEIF